MKKACINHPELQLAFEEYGPPSVQLWSAILSEKKVYTYDRYINTKNIAVNRKLIKLFTEEKERVTSHDLRRIYAHIAYTKHADKVKESEMSYYKRILGHDPHSLSNSVAYYTTVGLY